MSTTTSSTTTPPNQDIIVSTSASLLKSELTEFQCVLAVVAFESITDDMSSFKMKERMAQVILGDEKHGIASQINVLLQGIDPRYKNLFLPSIDGGLLVVNPLYSPNRGTKQLQVGKHLTFQILGRASVLSSSSNNAVSGVTLKRQAEETFRNGKITLSFANQFLDSNGELPSGKSEGDLLEYILEKMWDRKMASTQTAVNVETTAAIQRSKSEPPKERERSWVFKGFVAFCLYGCPVLTKSKDRLAHFQLVVNSRAQSLPVGVPNAKRS